MTENQSIFFDEWRQCLREHYRHVIHTQDEVTEITLRTVLQEIGFSEDEIEDMHQLHISSEDTDQQAQQPSLF